MPLDQKNEPAPAKPDGASVRQKRNITCEAQPQVSNADVVNDMNVFLEKLAAFGIRSRRSRFVVR